MFQWKHLEDAGVPVDNNAVENAIRPIELGRRNWLFMGSQQAGERAAVLMSLIESAKLNGHDAWAYLKDVQRIDADLAQQPAGGAAAPLLGGSVAAAADAQVAQPLILVNVGLPRAYGHAGLPAHRL